MILAVDGALEVGWALWDSGSWKAGENPCQVGVIVPRSRPNWRTRGEDMFGDFASTIGQFEPGPGSTAFLELPAFFESGGGASARTGSLVKLSMAVGGIWRTLDILGFNVEFVPVQEWKGQTKKEHTIRRVKKRLGEDMCSRLGITSHAWDAVGIGLYKQGRWV